MTVPQEKDLVRVKPEDMKGLEVHTGISEDTILEIGRTGYDGARGVQKAPDAEGSTQINFKYFEGKTFCKPQDHSSPGGVPLNEPMYYFEGNIHYEDLDGIYMAKKGIKTLDEWQKEEALNKAVEGVESAQPAIDASPSIPTEPAAGDAGKAPKK